MFLKLKIPLSLQQSPIMMWKCLYFPSNISRNSYTPCPMHVMSKQSLISICSRYSKMVPIKRKPAFQQDIVSYTPLLARTLRHSKRRAPSHVFVKKCNIKYIPIYTKTLRFLSSGSQLIIYMHWW